MNPSSFSYTPLAELPTYGFLDNAPAKAPAAGRRSASLSSRQLLDVELGLFLLSQLLPTAPPGALPGLLGGNGPSPTDGPVWTPRQHKYLNRARSVIGHFQHHAVWHTMIEQYSSLPNPLQQAYDISGDRSRFRQKAVGFFRNRTATFRGMLR